MKTGFFAIVIFASLLIGFVIGGVVSLRIASNSFDRSLKKVYENQKDCPDCICPPTISVAPFDVEKIKGVRNFTYSPSFVGFDKACDSLGRK